MRLLLVATLMLSSASAFANSEGSEFFWQAGAGKIYLIPELEYGTRDIDHKDGTSEEETGTELSLAGEYGFNEDMSFGAKLAYKKDETESGGTTTEDSGLGNIELYMKGGHALSGGTLRYGLELSLSPGDYETEANGDGNAYSGRHSLTPYVGYETTMDTITFGGKVSYEIALTDITEKDHTGAETKYSGGDELALAVFAETSHAAGRMGALLSHTITSDEKEESTGDKMEVPSVSRLAVYGDYSLNETTALTGLLGYDMVGGTDEVDDGSGFALLIGARFAL